MDVVDAGADLRRIGVGLEGVQQLHLRAGGLDGDDVGVHRADGGDDVVELRITHVGVANAADHDPPRRRACLFGVKLGIKTSLCDFR